MADGEQPDLSSVNKNPVIKNIHGKVWTGFKYPEREATDNMIITAIQSHLGKALGSS